MINALTNGHAFSVRKMVFLVTTTKSQSFMDLEPLHNSLMAHQ
jgi:hypothetical protein